MACLPLVQEVEFATSLRHLVAAQVCRTHKHASTDRRHPVIAKEGVSPSGFGRSDHRHPPIGPTPSSTRLSPTAPKTWVRPCGALPSSRWPSQTSRAALKWASVILRSMAIALLTRHPFRPRCLAEWPCRTADSHRQLGGGQSIRVSRLRQRLPEDRVLARRRLHAQADPLPPGYLTPIEHELRAEGSSRSHSAPLSWIHCKLAMCPSLGVHFTAESSARSESTVSPH